MDGEDHGAGGCCGTCGGVAPKPRLQPLAAAEARTRSVFRIPGMDCPSEEQMIRLRLAEARVPAGSALAVDRDAFSDDISATLASHPLITIERGEIAGLPPEAWDSVIIATGPLTSPALADAPARQLVDGIWFREIFVDRPGAEHGPLTSTLMATVSW